MKKKKPEKREAHKSLPTGKFGFFSIFLISLLVSFSPVKTSAQSTEYPFASGEYARYGAYYNWHFLWIQSGEVVFKADTVTYNHKKSWRLEATGKTLKTYDLLFSLRDTFETYCKYDTFDLTYSRRVLYHGKEKSVHQYWPDPSSRQIRAAISLKGETPYKGSMKAEPNTYDLLANAYNFRKFDFNKLFIGQKVPYRMIIGKEVADLYFHYLGKEKVKTRNGKEYLCHKVSVYLLQGDFFPEGEYMKIWFTDDKNHLPVQVESEIMVGSVKAVLLETKTLKYPVTSLIK